MSEKITIPWKEDYFNQKAMYFEYGMKVAVPDYPILHIDESKLGFDDVVFWYKKVNWKIYKAIFKKK